MGGVKQLHRKEKEDRTVLLNWMEDLQLVLGL